MITNNINKTEWNINIYNAIINCNSFKGNIKINESIELYNELLLQNLLPNIETFDALLSHHKNTNDSNAIHVEFMSEQ